MKKFENAIRRLISVFVSLAVVLSIAAGFFQTNVSAASMITYSLSYSSSKVYLTLSEKSSGNTIYYTANGSKPTTASKEYTKRLSSSSKVMIRAIEVNKSGKTVASIKLTIKPRVQTVKSSVTAYNDYSTVKLSCATAGATVYYTTDGSTPTSSSAKYTSKLKVTESCTIKAIAYKNDMKKSKVTSVFVEVGSVSDESEFTAEVVRLVNKERAKYGLSALSGTNDALNKAAQKRAEETITLFEHTRPDGTSCFTALKDYNVSYRAAAENIAYGQETPAEVVDAWMNSTGHRKNILNADFTEIGVGFSKYHWAQLFIG